MVSDNFNRADETPLAFPWAGNGGDDQFNLSANTAVPTTVGSDALSAYTTAGLSANHYSQAKLWCSGGTLTGQGIGVALRALTSERTYYRIIAGRTAINFEVARIKAGVYTQINAWAAAWNDGDTIRATVSGTGLTVTIKVYLNGIQIGTNTDDTSADRIITTGFPGITFSSLVLSASLDDWEADNLEAVVGRNIPRMGKGSFWWWK